MNSSCPLSAHGSIRRRESKAHFWASHIQEDITTIRAAGLLLNDGYSFVCNLHIIRYPVLNLMHILVKYFTNKFIDKRKTIL